jgi:hypothetical protein
MRVARLLGAASAATLFLIASNAQADDFAPIFVGRFSGGPSFNFDDDDIGGSGEINIGAALFTTERSNAFTDTWGLFLNPELGYTFLIQEGTGDMVHMFNLLFGVGIGHPYFAVDFRPRLLLGGGPEGACAGLRHSVGMHIFFDLFSFEGGHQFLGYDGLRHSAEILGGLNFGMLYQLATGELSM